MRPNVKLAGIGRLILVLSMGLTVGGAAAHLSSAQVFPPLARLVAPVVSPSWSDDAHRDHDEEVPQIAARLGIREGMTVADIGAGSGYDTVRLARWVGAKGRVVAEDVTPAYLTLLKGAVANAGIGNVEIKLGAEGDPGLAPRSIDRAIMIHMYHEIRAPYALLAHLAPAFRAHGLLGIEELDRPTVRHGTPPALLRCELSASGYQLQALSPLKGSLGYFAVFSPPKPGWRPGSAVRCTG